MRRLRLLEDDHLKLVLQKESQRGRAEKAQAQGRFLRGRQIAYMIYEHFRPTGAHEVALDLTDSFSVSLQGGDIQDFAARWDQAKLNWLQVK